MSTREIASGNPTKLKKKDADYVFYELTRSICPRCRKVIDAQVLLRDNKVYMRKRCPDCGPFEALLYSDAEAYTSFAKYNKPGTVPLAYSTEIRHGCPHDCGLCPDHQQHTCLGIIEVNSACNMNCPLCFSEARPGFNLTLEEVEQILDEFVRTEGNPEVVQFSGGEPTIHPQIIDFVRAAKSRGISSVMINTNGKRIARDDHFLEPLNDVRPSIYFQFDGFDSETYRILRGEPGILEEKFRALDRLAGIGLSITIVPAIEHGVNEHEVGRIIEFAIKHPAIRGINFQPAFHAGRYLLWLRFFAGAARVRLPMVVNVAAALAVWLIYVADRVLDSLQTAQAGLPMRHRFCRAHRRAFIILFAILFGSASWMGCSPCPLDYLGIP